MSTKPPIAARIPSATLKIFISRACPRRRRRHSTVASATPRHRGRWDEDAIARARAETFPASFDSLRTRRWISGEVGRVPSASSRFEAAARQLLRVDAHEVLRRAVPFDTSLCQELALGCKGGHVLGVALERVRVDGPAVAAGRKATAEPVRHSRSASSKAPRLSAPHGRREVSPSMDYESAPSLRNEASDHLVVMRAMFIAYWVFILLGFAFSFYIGIERIVDRAISPREQPLPLLRPSVDRLGLVGQSFAGLHQFNADAVTHMSRRRTRGFDTSPRPSSAET